MFMGSLKEDYSESKQLNRLMDFLGTDERKLKTAKTIN